MRKTSHLFSPRSCTICHVHVIYLFQYFIWFCIFTTSLKYQHFYELFTLPEDPALLPIVHTHRLSFIKDRHTNDFDQTQYCMVSILNTSQKTNLPFLNISNIFKWSSFASRVFQNSVRSREHFDDVFVWLSRILNITKSTLPPFINRRQREMLR